MTLTETQQSPGGHWVSARRPVKAKPAEILRLHREGLRTALIAERLGVSQKTVGKWLRHLLGDEWVNDGSKPTTEAQRARIVLLAREGVPDGWIAEDVSLSQRTVSDVRKAAGISVDDVWKVTRLQIQHDAELWVRHQQFAPPSLRRG